jgi:hypothetical protein
MAIQNNEEYSRWNMSYSHTLKIEIKQLIQYEPLESANRLSFLP